LVYNNLGGFGTRTYLDGFGTRTYLGGFGTRTYLGGFGTRTYPNSQIFKFSNLHFPLSVNQPIGNTFFMTFF
jgi:hypothetical protein